MKYTLLLYIILFNTTWVACQEMVTDRPDQTESALTIKDNYLQIETGTLLENAQDISSWVINSTLLRYGISDKLEFRVVSELFSNTFKKTDTKITGRSDVELGIKYNLVNSEFQLAYLSHIILPIGTDNFSTNQFGWSSIMCLSHSITSGIDFGYNLGFHLIPESEDSFIFTYAVGFALSDKFGFFTEIYGDYDGINNWSVLYDNGFTYAAKKNLQFDISLGIGLSDEPNFYSLGLSWRFPK